MRNVVTVKKWFANAMVARLKKKIKLSPVHAMKFGGMEVLSPLIFTLVLDGGECEVHAAAHYLQESTLVSIE